MNKNSTDSAKVGEVVLNIYLPFPQSVNRAYKVRGVRSKATGKYKPVFYKPKDTDEVKEFVSKFDALMPTNLAIPNAALKFEMVLYVPENKIKRKDLDNHFKDLQDRVFKASTTKANDHQIYKIYGEKIPIPKDHEPFVKVTLTVIEYPALFIPDELGLDNLNELWYDDSGIE